MVHFSLFKKKNKKDWRVWLKKNLNISVTNFKIFSLSPLSILPANILRAREPTSTCKLVDSASGQIHSWLSICFACAALCSQRVTCAHFLIKHLLASDFYRAQRTEDLGGWWPTGPSSFSTDNSLCGYSGLNYHDLPDPVDCQKMKKLSLSLNNFLTR